LAASKTKLTHSIYFASASPPRRSAQLLQSQLVDAENYIKQLEAGEAGENTYPLHANSLSSLRRINFKIQPNDFIAVVGSVGSGKSTLISAILGEMRILTSGKGVNVKGRVAYAAQTPFIFNDTLKNNIVFNKIVHGEKYDAVLEACALIPDLSVLPHGDQTEIGEKGINLSGGQKARISLARAVYHDADVYLLDDILSAVDAHVGRHLFESCIVNSLLDTPRQSSVVLVTNSLQFLSHERVTKIVVLDDGVIMEVGSYKELVSKGKLFKNLLHSIYDSSNSSSSSSSSSSSKKEEDLEEDANGNGNENENLLEFGAPTPPPLKEGGLTPTSVTNGGTMRDVELVNVKEREIKPPPPPPSSLMTDEMKERETGRVGLTVYLAWVAATGGMMIGLMIITMYGGVECLNIATRWWLSFWSEHGGGEEGNRSQVSATVIISPESLTNLQLFLLAHCSCSRASMKMRTISLRSAPLRSARRRSTIICGFTRL